jgi:MFS family permease
MYILFALTFFLGNLRVYHLIFFFSLYWIFGAIFSPAWNSWMGDLVNQEKKGSYFGKRNKIAGMASFAALLIAGYILQRFSGTDKSTYIGFVIIFSLALISRIISFFYLIKKYEPKYEIVEKAQFSFIEFLKQARFRNYGLFVFYLCFMSFAVFLSAPFFTPYMLKTLSLDYRTFTLIIAVPLIVKFFMLPVWGKLSDKYGSRKVLALTGFLMPIVPLLWVFSKEVWYLMLIQAYSGFVWAGFEISSFSFIFDSTSVQRRAICVAYYNALNGIFILVGAILGGLIVKYNNLFWSNYLLVFIVSFVLRYIASIVFIPKIKEVRTVEPISDKQLLLKSFSNHYICF